MSIRRRVWSNSSLSPGSTSRTTSTQSLIPSTVRELKVVHISLSLCAQSSVSPSLSHTHTHTLSLSLSLCVCVEGGALPRQKRRHGGGHIASKDVQAVYRKLTEVVENMALLLETQPLTDTTVLQVHSTYHHTLSDIIPSSTAGLSSRSPLSERFHSLLRT